MNKKLFTTIFAIVIVCAMLAFAGCTTECTHTALQQIAAVDATCVEDGNVEYWYCLDCGKYFSDAFGDNEITFEDIVISATGEHDWGEWVTDSESSCTTGGTRHRICNDCGERQEETLPVGEHDLNFIKAVEATCTEEGNVAYWHCSACGKNYSDEEATEVLSDVTTPKASHDMTFVEAQAHTCTNDGNVAYWHCGSCDLNYADESGEQELESVVDPAAHAWGEWEQTADPTCTRDGVLTRVCEVCFDEEYDYIDELGHDFENAEWAYNDANHWHLCNRCGAASQRELHEYDAEGICACGMIEYAPTSEFRFISLGNNTWRLANYTGTRRNVSIPSTYNGGTVVAISDNAFAGNTSMETLVIPDSVTSIGAGAFADCANLKALTMSSKVTTMGDRAFDGCDAIETASIPANAASYISKDNLVALTVTNGAIEEYAFASSPKLASVEVAGETSSIGREAFSGCAVLASVEVDGQGVTIGDNAFADCAMLTDVTFGDVVSIGDFAFKDCAAIGEVVIPDSVTSIGDGAFSGCSGLTSMRLPFVGGSEQTVSSASTLFGYIFGTESFANSFETVQLYGAEEGQSVAYYIPRNLSTVSVGGDIGFGAFYGCDRLVDVTIEESEKVDAYAFYNNVALSHIGIPTSVTHIGEMAFAYCTALEEIEFPGTINIVDKYAMSESAWYAAQPDGAVYIDKALYDYKGAFPEELQIKDGTYSVTSEAFLNAYALKSLVFPSSLEIFQDAAFDGCAVTDIVGKMEQISLFPKEAFERVTIIDSTSIPSSAFSGCENLTSITIPDSVTSIGDYAFYNCSGLTNITIPDSVTSIGSEAFYNCSSLTSVTIPDSVTSIEYRAFYGCSGLTSITIPDSVTYIGRGAFYDCGGLTSITIPFVGEKADGTGETHFGYIFGSDVPESLKEVIITGGTSIGERAFEDCSGLTSITIPGSVTSIGGRVFSGCSGLTSIVVEDGNPVYLSAGNCIIETESKTLIAGCKSSVIPDDGSVTSIGEDAFHGCSDLTNFTIPDSVTSIGDYAFYECSGLTSFTIPDSVTSIGDGAFSGCSGLTNVTIGNSVTSIGSSAFSGCSGLTSVTIPNSVTSIGSYVFYECSGLTSITIPFFGQRANGSGKTHFGYIFGASSYEYNDDYVPESLKEVTITGGTSIGDYAFYECSGLTSVTIPDSVTSIGDYAFYKCSGLTSVTIGNGVTSIGNSAFYKCSGLTSFVIPDSVTSIGSGAFWGCSFTDVCYQGDLSGWSEIEIGGYYANPMCYADNPYINGELLQGDIVIPDGTKKIGAYAFWQCSGLTSVTIPDSVTSIGEEAFRGCSDLTSVTIGNGVTSIGGSAFAYCRGLTSITIPDSVTSIGSYAFSGCSGLTSITIPFVGEKADGTGETHFGYIFGASSYSSNEDYVPSSLKEVIITGGTSIDFMAFYGCSGLTSVTIGNRVKSIDNRAFYGCSGLTSVTIGNSVTSIGEYAFYGCSGLTSVVIPDSVTSIRAQAFSGCSSLTSITIGNGVTSIYYRAFYECSGLTAINFRGTKAQWKAIRKDTDWDSFTGEYTVICTDGTISKADA